MSTRQPNYDKFPVLTVPNLHGMCQAGWPDIGARLRAAVSERAQPKTVLAVECYPGVDEREILDVLRAQLQPAQVFAAWEALKPEYEIERLCAPFLGGKDPVFGYLCPLPLGDFFAADRLAELKAGVDAAGTGLVLVVGVGATLIEPRPDLLVYADLARWEIQQRQRRKEISNLGVQNLSQPPGLQYKRAFFIDWRVADRAKKPLLNALDFLLDTNDFRRPKLLARQAFHRALVHAARRPFRVVPFFDPGPWGGHWMKEVCDLDRSARNFAWCFDCVPEENSLLLGVDGEQVEIPALDLVFSEAPALLGDPVHARFGTEFPIRFDFLDTMGGGNLSFQVHPLTEYIQQHFGMHYTQDESYYLLDAGPDATVYLGLKEGIRPQEMIHDLAAAQSGTDPFPAERYVNCWPARPHDHFLIPAGTCHCSGKNSMVLEISATPYIFTFKLWDWGRLGLDGKPRPIHLRHGFANIDWRRTTSWVKANLINRIAPVAQGDGWREERTGLHEREFIETRRHWFTRTAPHHTGGEERGSVQVLNLVQGEEAVVESPDHRFEPFVVHYAETFIVPAAVGGYTIRPHGPGAGQECATMKAFVRTGL